jgi:ribosomal protein S18 acetylase RimI-like enzyme
VKEIEVKKNGKVIVKEIEDIRRSVGWDPNAGRYKKAMKNTYSHYTIRQKGRLIAFARVISDGSVYGLIVDVVVRPEFQNKGIGKRLMRFILKDLKRADIKSAQLLLRSGNEMLDHFYSSLGFDIGKSGILKLGK